MSIAFAVGRQTHAALATAEFCVRTTPSSLGLQARPACSANVQSVHQFHATPAICMRRAAPLSSLRASQAQSRDARRETRTLRKRRVKSSCFVWKDLSKRLAQHNVIQNARGFLTKQVMRCRARLTAPLGRAQPPLSTTPYWSRRRRFEGNELRNPQPSCDRENDFLDGNSVEHRDCAV